MRTVHLLLCTLALACVAAQGGASFADARAAGASSPPNPYPRLVGHYVSRDEHPRVFTRRAELTDLVTRINEPGSFSAENFAKLATRVRGDLAAKNDWDVAYSGCKIDDYLYGFSYDDAHAAQVEMLRNDLHLGAEALPPIGAAIVASRAALYATLARDGARVPAGGPSPKDAIALAKRILSAWARHGFRAADGRYLDSNTQFCDDDGKFDAAASSAVGLQVSRGILYSVQAQDLLESLRALRPDERRELDRFHRAIYDLVRNALDETAHGIPCNQFGNHKANDLAGLLSIARLLDDRRAFEAALYGNDRRLPVTLPWVAYFDRAVYGAHDTPNACYHNTGPNGLTSRPFFQTAVVAPGEIDDRFRNKDAAQGIGYPMFSLERIFNAAEILRIAGFDPYAYRGRHGQSIESAVRYYVCYARHAGFEAIVTDENGRACPDYAQYVGKTVSEEQNMLFGAYRFRDDAEITSVERAARASPQAIDLDALRFGRWND
jgi:hypothetical protein